MALDTAQYESARRSVNTQWSAKRAANEYGRHVAQQRGSRQVGDNAREFGRAWPKFSAGWGKRGHTAPGMKSGFYQKAMSNYLGDHQRNTNTLLDGIQQEQQQFELSGSRMDADRDRALADIEMEKQRAIALLAQNIQAVKPSIY